jgi:hypothetical protein
MFLQSALFGDNPDKLYYKIQVRCGDEGRFILDDEEVEASDPRFIRMNSSLLGR